MRPVIVMLAGALGGAAIAIAVIMVMAQNGLVPINDRQMQAYLMQHPDLVPAMMARSQALDDQKQAQIQAEAMRKVGQAAFFDPAVAFVTGPADAKTSLVEFYDYDCPYCRASLPAVKRFYDAHKNDTRFSFIEFPIADLHGPSALLAARASLAARRQPAHYMDFHFLLLGEEGQVSQDMIFADAAKAGMDVNKLKADMTDPAIEKTLTSSIALAHKVGVDGTPTFVLNGKFHPGAVDDDTLASEMKS
ncbi:MAG TPA: DsbA family protein [Rhizomicrobium sp.]|nr:DsbA family protein [Rhizomicrobium sp.]